MSKKSSTFVADFKNTKRKGYFMATRTQSSFIGLGHRIQLIKRDEIAKSYSVLDNRRVVISTPQETLAKDVFLNTIAGIVRQTSIRWEGAL